MLTSRLTTHACRNVRFASTSADKKTSSKPPKRKLPPVPAKEWQNFDRVSSHIKKKMEASGIPVSTKERSFKRKEVVVVAKAAKPETPVLRTVVAEKTSTVLPSELVPDTVKAPAVGTQPKVPASTSAEGKRILLALPAESLKGLMPSDSLLSKQSFRVTQLHDAIYKNGVTSFDEITTLSKSDRALLSQQFEIGRPESISETLSSDGTRKCLLGFAESVSSSSSGKLAAAAKVECVYIPGTPDAGGDGEETAKATLCVSSQVGCSLACTFCHTGTQKLLRNLEPWEMVAQVMHGMKIAGDFNSTSASRTLTNIVLMGQGEPLHNYKNLSPFIKTLTTSLNFHPSKITLSTSGIAPLIPRVATDLGGISLAISLHATNDNLRSRIMPINKQYPLHVLMQSIREYIHLHAQNTALGKRHKRVTFEYVMLKGVNDSIAEAEALVTLVRNGLKIGDAKELRSLVHVNLIPFHKWEGSEYECSDARVIEAFRRRVIEGGVNCHLRESRGLDVLGACGQLRSMDMFKSKRLAVE
ncbi:hypothetical protein HDU81_001602 [Chytriomyces hyalinus]|nr:hypothetical protein HDU81_001602 [Chytriomyces hyalinus]